jgi:type I restriction enzyme S subunit
MRKLEKYDSYKESGVEWLGEIPEHWNILANRYIFTIKKDLVGKKSSEYDLLSLTLQGIIKRDMENLQGKFPAEFDTYQEVKQGDFIFCLFDVEETPRTVGLSTYDGMITGAYTVMSVENMDKNYLYYFYLNLDSKKRLKPLYKGLRNTIPKDSFFSFKTFVPPKSEQTTIASFLDTKTAQIDQAIRQKEQLIELLKERRQIVINEAVTKGLNPNIPMKESGVEWIGEIPEHWEVKKLKFIIKNKLKYGANESGISYDEELPRYVRITDFSDSGKLSEKNKLSLTWEKGRDYLLEDGDILFARSGATVGKTYQFKRSMSSEKYYAFAGYLIKAEANEKIILSDYLYLYTNSNLFNKWKESIFNKATIENIGADKYSGLYFTLPPLEEQKRILEQYFVNGSKIDAAIELQQNYIEKLKEYKATLIDSVVTGKVRVA